MTKMTKEGERNMLNNRKTLQMQEIKSTIKGLIQQTSRETLEAELEELLGYSRYQRRIRRTTVTVILQRLIKTSSGPIQIQVPRNRNGEFEPKLIGKHQTVLDEI